MEKLKNLSCDELRELTGGQKVLSGYPGQSLVNFIWKTLRGAYQHGVDDKLHYLEPCT